MNSKESSLYVDTKEIAARTGTSPSFWNQLRMKGCGPRFYKVGSRVLYNVNDIDSWLKSRARNSTSEPEYKVRQLGTETNAIVDSLSKKRGSR